MTAPDDSERAEILAEMAALARKLDPDPAVQVNEELASLREEIAGLRQQIAAQPRHGCCHHSCWHYCYPNTWISTGTTITYPQTWTISSGGTTYSVGGGSGGAIT